MRLKFGRRFTKINLLAAFAEVFSRGRRRVRSGSPKTKLDDGGGIYALVIYNAHGRAVSGLYVRCGTVAAVAAAATRGFPGMRGSTARDYIKVASSTRAKLLTTILFQFGLNGFGRTRSPAGPPVRPPSNPRSAERGSCARAGAVSGSRFLSLFIRKTFRFPSVGD